MASHKERFADKMEFPPETPQPNIYPLSWNSKTRKLQEVWEAALRENWDPEKLPWDTLDVEERRYIREGLDSEEQLAVFDLLQKDTLTKGDRDAIKKVAVELLDKLTSGKLQIDHWREKATAQAQVKAEIIKHLFAHLPPGAYDADEINLKADAVFVHLYTSGVGGGGQAYH